MPPSPETEPTQAIAKKGGSNLFYGSNLTPHPESPGPSEAQEHVSTSSSHLSLLWLRGGPSFPGQVQRQS